MDAKLVIVGGKAGKGPISLKLPTIIGRSREADLTVAHPMISRQHCKLFEVDGLLKIQDLGSLNGTFVGQEKITEADLPPQSQFTVGPLTFRVDYEYAGPVDTRPPAEQQQAAAPQSPDIITLGVVPDFLATAVAPDGQQAQPQPDSPAGFAPVGVETLDFSALGLDGADRVKTEPQPAPDQAGQEAAEAPQGPVGQAAEEMAVDAPAPARADESPPPPGEDQMPDFLAGPAPGAAGSSKPADPEEDILDFLK
jgi:predicted component of type VI protein secretion system